MNPEQFHTALHHLYGTQMYHQERYLRKLTSEQRQQYISILQSQIDLIHQVDSQMNTKLQFFQTQYQPKHPHLYQFQSYYHGLHPQIQSCFHAQSLTITNKNRLLQLIEETSQQENEELLGKVYCFPLFSDWFCQQLVEEMEHVEQQWNLFTSSHNPINSMSSFTIGSMNDIGMGQVMNQFLTQWFTPLIKQLFVNESLQSMQYFELDSQHSYCVQYEISKQKDLAMHSDDSEVTCNICLGKEFVGGELYFGTVRQDSSIQHNQIRSKYQHKIGYAILHLGYLIHGAESIQQGKRMNLIMWLRSSKYRNQICPCCRHFNRNTVQKVSNPSNYSVVRCVCHPNFQITTNFKKK